MKNTTPNSSSWSSERFLPKTKPEVPANWQNRTGRAAVSPNGGLRGSQATKVRY